LCSRGAAIATSSARTVDRASSPHATRPGDHDVAAGKKPKVALTAAMRKLLTILNAMVKHQQSWRLATD
jgi:transposase